ncbi:MAG: ComEC/Rec2 family competence protein [Patiriisocius sp.]|uniref:ComEC/Rec2 family competence protein n=1 Tax=Patiriisocius sp. TaxID=2822396 RepID=UPI003EF1FB65
MKFINSTILQVSIAYLFGIIAGIFASEISISFFPVVAILLLLLGITVLVARKQLFPNTLFGTVLLLLFFFLGSYKYQQTQPQFKPEHYSHTVDLNTEMLYQITISEILKPNTYNSKYIATVESINGQPTKGNVLVTIQKDTINPELEIDTRILIKSTAAAINAPLNPDQFDYQKYMQSLGVYHQLRIKNNEIAFTEKASATLRGLAEKSRTFIIGKLKETPIGQREQAIIQALVLGQKRDLDKTLYAEYAAAGAIHILAVSGLHVGIIFFILQFIFRPLIRIKRGELFRSLLIVLCLWVFAFITGLSPSVCRAVTMFSCLAFAGLLNRRSATMNTLALSFIILLFYNPLWVFHVGFQLSYLAVLSIILIQPKLYSYYMPRNYIKRKAWGILTVTLAAQVGILPLSIYYFHQFPGLFFITNIIVLPFLGLILGIGIIVLILAAIGMLPDFIATSYGWIIEQMNGFIGWVAAQDSFLFRDIPFSKWNVFAFYFLIIALLLFWYRTTGKRLILSLVAVAFCILTFIADSQQHLENKLVIFQKSRKTIIGIQQASEMRLFKSDTTTKYQSIYPLKSFSVANYISEVKEEKLPKYFEYNNTPIIILDSLGVYPKISERPIIIFTESPKINLTRVIDSLQPLQIIADGSNYHSSVGRWKATCEMRGIPFHHTGKDGAFVLSGE